ncbi:MAG: RagB/SusD family nutrient uptake outer membrane protein, partial [Clostridiales bacterium]|nr:RagB/SusD family nutrient uptake outer membrane protein [Clostridiales bacterium]
LGSYPKQIKRAELYDWMVKDLTDVIDNSPLAAPRGNGYARVDKGVAKFILAKLYMNAEVYAGVKAYDKCAEVLKDLMDDGYSLHTKANGKTYNAYQDLFLADNHTCTDEIIFGVEHDGVNTTSYGGTNYFIFASVGGKMDPSEFGISSGWGGLRTTPEFYDKFSAGDARKLFWDEETSSGDQQKDITDIGEFTNGFGFMKFRNKTSAGSNGQELGFVDTDFPMFRYADVLLMAAECQARGASIDGLSAFNQVRARANLPAVNSLGLDEIIDERGRELYQECWRRSDLVRFGLFTTSKYLWQWKGNIHDGQSVADHLNLFPIPADDLLVNENLDQNEGYVVE